MRYSIGDDPDYWYDLKIEAEQRWDSDDLAAFAAEDYHDNHDGWESSWPLVITVDADHLDRPVAHKVEREHEPVFTASYEPVEMPKSD